MRRTDRQRHLLIDGRRTRVDGESVLAISDDGGGLVMRFQHQPRCRRTTGNILQQTATSATSASKGLNRKVCTVRGGGTHPRATERHPQSYGITHCYLPPNTAKRTVIQAKADGPVLVLHTLKGQKAELTRVVGYIYRDGYIT